MLHLNVMLIFESRVKCYGCRVAMKLHAPCGIASSSLYVNCKSFWNVNSNVVRLEMDSPVYG